MELKIVFLAAALAMTSVSLTSPDKALARPALDRAAEFVQSTAASGDLTPCQLDVYTRCLATTGDHTRCVHVAMMVQDC